MAVVREYKHPNGCTVRIHDDDLAKDQKKAWAEAYKVAEKIHWQHVLADLARQQQAQA